MAREPRARRPRQYDPVLPSDLPPNPTLADKQRVGTTDPSIVRKKVSPKIPESYSQRRPTSSSVPPPIAARSTRPERSRVEPVIPEMPRTRTSVVDLSSPSRKSGERGGGSSEISPPMLAEVAKRRSSVDLPPAPESASGRRSGGSSLSLPPLSPPDVMSGAEEPPEQKGFGFQGITGIQTASPFYYGGGG